MHIFFKPSLLKKLTHSILQKASDRLANFLVISDQLHSPNFGKNCFSLRCYCLFREDVFQPSTPRQKLLLAFFGPNWIRSKLSIQPPILSAPLFEKEVYEIVLCRWKLFYLKFMRLLFNCCGRGAFSALRSDRSEIIEASSSAQPSLLLRSFSLRNIFQFCHVWKLIIFWWCIGATWLMDFIEHIKKDCRIVQLFWSLLLVGVLSPKNCKRFLRVSIRPKSYWVKL